MKYLDRLSLCFCFIFFISIKIFHCCLTFSVHTLVSNSILCQPCVSRLFRYFPFCSFLLYVGMRAKVAFIATALAPIDTRYYNCTVYSGLECRLCDLPIAIINCFTHEYDSTHSASYLLSAERPKRNRETECCTRMRSTKKCKCLCMRAWVQQRKAERERENCEVWKKRLTRCDFS